MLKLGKNSYINKKGVLVVSSNNVYSKFGFKRHQYCLKLIRRIEKYIVDGTVKNGLFFDELTFDELFIKSKYLAKNNQYQNCFEITENGYKVLTRFIAPVSIKQPNKIYVIAMSGTTSIKIGITQNISNRLKGLQHSNPQDLTIEYVNTCENVKKIESLVHKYFSESRLNGEWFDLDYRIAIDFIDKEISLRRWKQN